MATTANTQRSTASVRGNHPAGRALLRPTGERRDGTWPVGRPAASEGVAPLRLVRGGCAAPAAAEELAEVLAFPVCSASAAGEGEGEVEVEVEVGDVVPLRLTRRGRRVVAGLVLVGGLGFAVLVGSAVLGGGAVAPGLALAGESSVVVQPGDTLWSIASDIAPEEDPRGVVDALQEANGLEGSSLVPGQVLLVP